MSTTLAKALGCDVRIDNNVNLAAIAERSEGAGHDTSSFALLWMDEGLGLAVDLGGAVHRGAGGGAGEIGYLPVPREAEAIDATADTVQDLLGAPIGNAGGETLARLVSEEITRAQLWHPIVTASTVAEFPVLRGPREVLMHEVRALLLDELSTLPVEASEAASR